MNANDIRICFIGDSYVQGTGDDDCLGWAGRLCAIPYVATLPALIDDRAWTDEVRDNDGVYPRARGYARLAQIVAASGAWWFGKQ